MALHTAAQKGDLTSLQAALSSGAELNGTDRSGRTALHLAAATGHAEAVKVLLEREADVDLETKDGDTAL